MRTSVMWIAIAILVKATAGSAQQVAVDAMNQSNGTLDTGLRFGGTVLEIPIARGGGGIRGKEGTRPIPAGEGIWSKRTPGGNQGGLDLVTNNTPKLSITRSGRIGVGTLEPSRLLEMRSDGSVELGLASNDNGGRLWTIQSSGVTGGALDATFQVIDRSIGDGVARLVIDKNGTTSVNVLRITGGADLAEPFQSSDAQMVPGAVVVIDEQQAGQLKLSSEAYDRRVAGVVSGAGGVRPAITLDQLASDTPGTHDVNVALTGRVYVWADATNGPIKPGDLLTTSSTPGHCMKATDYDRAKGAVLGKAMSGLDTGSGLILALVTLQ